MPNIEQHMLFVMNKSTHGEHSNQPSQTQNKQFNICNILNCLQWYFLCYVVKKTISISQKQLVIKMISIILIHRRVLTQSNVWKWETKRNTNAEQYFTEANYPFKNEPDFSAIGSVIEISGKQPLISFTPDDSIRDTFWYQCRQNLWKN